MCEESLFARIRLNTKRSIGLRESPGALMRLT